MDLLEIQFKNATTPKFKVGWYVRVKEDLKINQTYNELPFLEQMEKYKGKVFKIRISFHSLQNKRYFLENVIYEFSEEMLEFPSINELKKYRKVTEDILNDEIKTLKKINN